MSGSYAKSRGAIATALTVYGIETPNMQYDILYCRLIATALTVYGIET